MAWVEPGSTMVTAVLSYWQLTRSWIDHGGNVLEESLDAFLGLDLEAMAAAVDDTTGQVTICNPNNPTGTLLDPEDLEAWIHKLPDSIIVFVDEAYVELSENGESVNSMARLVPEMESLVIARTFSNVYGMAGLQLPI